MYYDNNVCGCGGFQNNFYPCGGYTNNQTGNSSYAIVLVLFILLVIVIGSRFTK